MEPYLSPNNNASLDADAEAEQNHRTRSPTTQHPIVMSSGRSVSRRSPNSSPYHSTHLRPSLPQTDARRLEQQIYAGMQRYPSRPGGVSRGGVPFFGRHHQVAFERGEVYLAPSATHHGIHSEFAAASANPTPSRLRGQPPGEDSYSAEYGPPRHLHGARPPHLSSQQLMASYSELEARHPSLYGSAAMTAVAMSDLPPRFLGESFVRRHGPIAPSPPAAEISSDLSGNPNYGRYEPTTRRSPPSHFPTEEDDEEEMPPLPPLPNAQPLVQPHQEPEQDVQGESHRRRQEVQTHRRPGPHRQVSMPTTTVAREFANEAEIFHFPRPLGIPSDAKYLTEFHCFLRSNLIEVFCATNDDMNGKLHGHIFIMASIRTSVELGKCISLTRNQFSTLFTYFFSIVSPTSR